jgi:predicted nuclease of predicted toxin-antitoxin system
MKFLCDVHISIKVVKHLQSKGYECLHVKDILKGTTSSDKDICKFADDNDYIVITKVVKSFQNNFS